MTAKSLGLSLAAAVVGASALWAGLAPAAGQSAGAPPGGSGVIGGHVWLDRCGPTAESCVPLGDGHARGNGLAQPGEPGLAAITVALLDRHCAGDPIALTVTDAEGAFAFEDLEPGVYCVTVDPRNLDNAVIAPGRWTAPLSGRLNAPASRLALLSAGAAVEVDFGRDTDWVWPLD